MSPPLGLHCWGQKEYNTMLASAPSRFLGQPITDEDTQTFAFIIEVGNLVEGLAENLDYGVGQLAGDFETEPDDYIRISSIRQQLIRQFASFLLQRPVADKEMVREHLLDFEPVNF